MHDALLIRSKGTPGTGEKSLKHSSYERVEQMIAIAAVTKMMKLSAEGGGRKAT